MRLIPLEDELDQLPQWASVAYAVRAARRVLPLARPAEQDESDFERALIAGVIAAEQLCDNPIDPKLIKATKKAKRDVLGVANSQLRFGGWQVFFAVHQACDYALMTALRNRTHAMFSIHYAVQALVYAADRRTPLVPQLQCFRRDFLRLRKLSHAQNWVDETPVPMSVFGPLWPTSCRPLWSVT